jgi:mannose-6-phosphate isomerase-like protein (cupin superfamily)
MGGSQPEVSHPFVTRAGEGTALWHLDTLKVLKAVGAATDNRLMLWEELLPQHSSPPLHVHHREDEAWYVLDGSLTYRVEEDETAAGAGDFVWAPRGRPHTFRVESPTARLLGLVVDAGFEEFFLASGTPAQELILPPPPDGPPDLDALIAHAGAVGVDIVGPPMPPPAE